MRAEIDDLMPRGAQLAEQFLLQMKATLIRGNGNAHSVSPRSCMRAHETQQIDSRRCTSLRDQEPDWALYLSSTSLSSLHSIHRKSRWRPPEPRFPAWSCAPYSAHGGPAAAWSATRRVLPLGILPAGMAPSPSRSRASPATLSWPVTSHRMRRA